MKSNTTTYGLEGCERCPVCHKIPTPTIGDKGIFSVACEQHGYEALGDSLEEAISHWNRLILFVRKQVV